MMAPVQGLSVPKAPVATPTLQPKVATIMATPDDTIISQPNENTVHQQPIIVRNTNGSEMHIYSTTPQANAAETEGHALALTDGRPYGRNAVHLRTTP